MPVAPIWICPFCKKEYEIEEAPEDKKCPECQTELVWKESLHVK